MIYGTERAHSRVPYVMVMIPVLLPWIVLIGTYSDHGEPAHLAYIFLIASLPGMAFIGYFSRFYKQIYYDDSFIYIKSFFGKTQDVITYGEVVELVKRLPLLPSQKGDRSAIHTLTYHSKNGIKKVKFFASFFYRQTDLLKRKLGSYKVTEK